MKTVLTLQNDILELVARGDPLADTGHALCLRVEALLPGVVCSIIAVDADRRLRPLAAPSLPKEFCKAVDGVLAGPEVGACGSAVYLGEPVESLDIASDPRWTGFAELPLAIGLKACRSTPIFGRSGEVLGAFAFYFRQHRTYTAQEFEFLQAAVHLCAIAMERERHTRAQYRMAYIDMLTELPNRAAFNVATNRIEAEGSSAAALLIIDLDNLKMVNDTFGHKAGDCLLKGSAGAIEKGAAPHIAYRLGGDEFAVLIRSATMDPETLEGHATAILHALDNPLDCDGHAIIPRATIGGACSDGGTAVEDLRQNADFALYHAKETLRGGFVAYSDDLGSTITRRLVAIRKVGDALREGRIDAYYQPIVRIETGEVVGLEALFRVLENDGSIVAAGDYMDATSDVHTATLLTERMLDLVARDVRTWLDLGIWFQHVGINAASADFQGGRLHAALEQAFAREDVSLEHVILEVTESVYMDQDGVVAREIQSLRGNGLRVALDDFGTGFASLTHLLSLPVDIIKIDKSFVARMEPGSRSAAIVEGLITIAAKLGLRVVAEGVETREQAELLEQFGCALAQGYLYGRPADRETTTRLLFDRAQKRDPDVLSTVAKTAPRRLRKASGLAGPMRYAVLLCGTDWRVVSARRQLGHFKTRNAAFQCALRLAREANASGLEVELLYAEDGGELRALHLAEAKVTEAALQLQAQWVASGAASTRAPF